MTESARMLVHLFELRHSPRVATAHVWLFSTFDRDMEWHQIADHLASRGALTIVLEYWEMVAILADEDKLLDLMLIATSREHLAVWDRIKPWIQDVRRHSRDNMLQYLEQMVVRHQGPAATKPQRTK